MCQKETAMLTEFASNVTFKQLPIQILMYACICAWKWKG